MGKTISLRSPQVLAQETLSLCLRPILQEKYILAVALHGTRRGSDHPFRKILVVRFSGTGHKQYLSKCKGYRRCKKLSKRGMTQTAMLSRPPQERGANSRNECGAGYQSTQQTVREIPEERASVLKKRGLQGRQASQGQNRKPSLGGGPLRNTQCQLKGPRPAVPTFFAAKTDHGEEGYFRASKPFLRLFLQGITAPKIRPNRIWKQLP